MAEEAPTLYPLEYIESERMVVPGDEVTGMELKLVGDTPAL